MSRPDGPVSSRQAPLGPDEERLRAALAEAGRGHPSPNPHVGALLVKGDAIVGQGFHERAGGDHAEIVALRQAGRVPAARRCSSRSSPATTRTDASRTDAILNAGARVVIGRQDPNPT